MGSILLGLIVLMVCGAALLWLRRYLELPDILEKVIVVVLVLLFVILLLQGFGVFGNGHVIIAN